MLEEGYKERRQAPPAWLTDKPIMDTSHLFYWQAYWDLSSCRSEAGMPIPWTAMDAFATRWGIRGNNDFDAFNTTIRMMESGYFSYREERERTNNLSK